jgi:hypothetical protein
LPSESCLTALALGDAAADREDEAPKGDELAYEHAMSARVNGAPLPRSAIVKAMTLRNAAGTIKPITAQLS